MRSPVVVVAAVVAFVSLVPGAALADPDVGAQVQLGRAFEACERGEGGTYLEIRDFALKADPSLKTWSGKLRNKWSVKETLAKCDQSMGQAAAKDSRDANNRSALNAFLDVCRYDVQKRQEPALVVSVKKARSEYVAKVGRGHEDPRVAECEADVVRRVSEDVAYQKAEAARLAQMEIDAAKARQREAIRKKQIEAVIAKMTGDRRKLFERSGWPNGAPDIGEEKIAKLARWTYVEEVTIGSTTIQSSKGDIYADHTAPCSTHYDFAGDKIVKISKAGPGCR